MHSCYKLNSFLIRKTHVQLVLELKHPAIEYYQQLCSAHQRILLYIIDHFTVLCGPVTIFTSFDTYGSTTIYADKPTAKQVCLTAIYS